MQIYSLHKKESFLKGKRNNKISEEISGGCKVIDTWGAVGEKMIPRNIRFLMCCFNILGMPGLPGYIIGKENNEKELKPPLKERKKENLEKENLEKNYEKIGMKENENERIIGGSSIISPSPLSAS